MECAWWAYFATLETLERWSVLQSTKLDLALVLETEMECLLCDMLMGRHRMVVRSD